MAQVTFAKAIRRHVDCPAADVPGATLREVLDCYFAEHPDVRRYVLDDRGSVRRHIAIFVGDELIIDRFQLSDTVDRTTTVSVFQALSGG